MLDKYVTAVGRRKTSIARVRIKKGKGSLIINKRDLKSYFNRPFYETQIMQPLVVTDSVGAYDVIINVKGGGLTGQVGAIKHGLARALTIVDSSNRSSLKKNGLLTRDSRMVERKKYGLKGARKSFQFSKR